MKCFYLYESSLLVLKVYERAEQLNSRIIDKDLEDMGLDGEIASAKVTPNRVIL